MLRSGASEVTAVRSDAWPPTVAAVAAAAATEELSREPSVRAAEGLYQAAQLPRTSACCLPPISAPRRGEPIYTPWAADHARSFGATLRTSTDRRRPSTPPPSRLSVVTD